MTDSIVPVVEKLPEIINSIIELVKIGFPPVVIISIAIAALMIRKAPLILDYVKKSRAEKLENIQKAIECQYALSETQKNHLENLYARIMFARATGLDCNNRLADLIINFVNLSNGEFTLKSFININEFVKYDDSGIKIELNALDWYQLLIMQILFLILVVTCSVVASGFIIIPLLNETTLHKYLITYFSMLLVLLILLFMYVPYAQKYNTISKLYKTKSNLFSKHPPSNFIHLIVAVILISIAYGFYLFLASWFFKV